jgi:methenyltetrahydrofolate cyclohydrolase
MPYANTSIAEFAAAVADRTPAPASGSALAVTGALAAALVELTARFSDDEAAVAEAERLRARLLELADEDAEAYTAFMRDRTDETRAVIVAVPEEIARLAATVAQAAERLERDGNPRLAGDATAGRLLASAVAEAAARLVELNRAAGPQSAT